MAVERSPSAIWFMLRINMQHYSCDFAPVSTPPHRVKQAQIRDDVLFVVDGAISATSGLSGGFCMGFSQHVVDQFCAGLLGVLMSPPSPLCPPTTDIRRGEQHVCFVP
jgi:hypothetical protein